MKRFMDINDLAKVLTDNYSIEQITNYLADNRIKHYLVVENGLTIHIPQKASGEVVFYTNSKNRVEVKGDGWE